MRSLIAVLFFTLIACSTQGTDSQPTITDQPEKDLSGFSVAYFASGCFWCVEAVYESVEGVEEAISGYAGGNTVDPTYEEVGTQKTGHAETVAVYYDAEVVDFETLLTVYYASQDPTQVNGQGPDRGSAYRSIIFYQNEEERVQAQAKKDALDASAAYDAPIATEILAFEAFYEAEDYHQNYERLNPNHPYVRAVSVPRLKRFQAKHPELLKKGE